MKTSCIIFFTLLLVGCAGPHQSASLTSDQANTVATRLASDKALALYHCSPFSSSEAARFLEGHWVWVGHQGYGHGDIQATVELAADGSTNSVVLRLLDNMNLLSRGGGGF
jgi:hypothetical protein